MKTIAKNLIILSIITIVLSSCSKNISQPELTLLNNTGTYKINEPVTLELKSSMNYNCENWMVINSDNSETNGVTESTQKKRSTFTFTPQVLGKVNLLVSIKENCDDVSTCMSKSFEIEIVE